MSVRDASISGVLSAGIVNSDVLKHVVVVDAFGRDYSADLTKAVRNSGFELVSYFTLDRSLDSELTRGGTSTGYRSVINFVQSAQFGLVEASGLVNTTSTAAIFSAQPSARDQTQSELSNIAISAFPANNVSFDLGYQINLSGRINEYDTRASQLYDGLFLSASSVNSPYTSLTNGGTYIGTAVLLSDGLKLRAGFSWLKPDTPWSEAPASDSIERYFARSQLGSPAQRDAGAATLAMSWNFAEWGGIGIVGSDTIEQNGVLGGTATGALNFARQAETIAVDSSVRVRISDSWLATISYGEGTTNLSIQPGSLLSSATALHSQSYGLALGTGDIFGDDAFGFAVSRPMYVSAGSGNYSVATGVDPSGNLTISQGRLDFAARAPETDFEIGYTKLLLNGRVSIQSNAAYQWDIGGQSSRNALSALLRVKASL